MTPIGSVSNSPQTPPAKLKVFAPNGDTRVFRGWIGIRKSPRSLQLAELFLMEDKLASVPEVVNKKAVVQNLETGEVVYDPRRAPETLPGLGVLMTGSEKAWLKNHPHWPALAEVYGNPVEDDDGEGDGGGVS